MDSTAPPLLGRTALVTGGAKRLGRAIALRLAEAGADVAIHYHSSADAAADTADAVAALGRRAWALPADLDDPDAAADLFARAAEQAGAIDILVNNASNFPANRVLEFPLESLWENLRLHAASPLMLARALAQQGRPGDIVNMLDSRVVDYDHAHAAYHLSKRTLLTLTKMLALELAPAIKVNAVAPGLILPPPGQNESYLQQLASTNPLNRHGSPEGIAEAVLFLVRSDFVTGQVLYVDGGRHMKGCVYGG